MIAKTIKGKSPEEIQSALQQSMSDGYKPRLAIVFISVKQDRAAICKLLDEKSIQIFGATTAGEFIDGDIGEGSIAIMLLDIDPAYFRISFLEITEGKTYEVSEQVGNEGKNIFSNPSFLIVSTWEKIDGEEIVAGIDKAVGADATIFGGLAGDDLQLKESFVFTNEKDTNIGLLAIIIDSDKIEMKGLATCGWKPIGITKTITKSKANIVYTIDDQPALDLVIKYLGLDIDLDPNKDVLTNIGAYYPLQLEREDAPPVMRTAMWGNLEDRSLICAGNVPQGAKVRFSLPPDFDVIDTVVNECAGLKNSEHKTVDAVIMFSCISRYLSFGVMTREEIERVIKVWNAPFVGFFSYGEFGKSKRGKHEFHNNTCCVVTLKEK